MNAITQTRAVNDLKKHWPQYWSSHNISDTEFARIAAASSTVEDAQETWDQETWWRDDASQDAIRDVMLACADQISITACPRYASAAPLDVDAEAAIAAGAPWAEGLREAHRYMMAVTRVLYERTDAAQAAYESAYRPDYLGEGP